MFYFDPTYFLIVGPLFALSFYVQNQLKSKFKKFSKQPLSANLTGKEVAEKMLNDHGIYDVKIISVKGQLSDHYNPQKRQLI
jgi:Zn-dependent membrane protease YugP